MGAEGLEYVLVEHPKCDANYNLAIDEALLQLSKETGKIYIRFHNYEKPAIIAAYRQAVGDFNVELMERKEMQFARRKTAGGAMFCHGNDAGKDIHFSIVGAAQKNILQNPQQMHDHYGKLTLGILEQWT